MAGEASKRIASTVTYLTRKTHASGVVDACAGSVKLNLSARISFGRSRETDLQRIPAVLAARRRADDPPVGRLQRARVLRAAGGRAALARPAQPGAGVPGCDRRRWRRAGRLHGRGAHGAGRKALRGGVRWVGTTMRAPMSGSITRGGAGNLRCALAFARASGSSAWVLRGTSRAFLP